MDDIHFHGDTEHGYTARRGTSDARVRETPDGWVGSFAGNPQTRNPWVEDPSLPAPFTRRRSCMCPTVTLPPAPTREAAATAALDAYELDRA